MEPTTVPPLAEALAALPDFQAARGKRHGLLPIPRLACVATRCGSRSQAAMAAWGRDHERARRWAPDTGAQAPRAVPRPTWPARSRSG